MVGLSWRISIKPVTFKESPVFWTRPSFTESDFQTESCQVDLNITTAHSLTSEASTLHGDSVRLCQIRWHSICFGWNSVFAQSQRCFLFLLQSTRAVPSLQATEQDKAIVHPVPLAAWHLESLFVYLSQSAHFHCLSAKVGRIFLHRQMLWHFWEVKDYHDLNVGDLYPSSWLMLC